MRLVQSGRGKVGGVLERDTERERERERNCVCLVGRGGWLNRDRNYQNKKTQSIETEKFTDSHSSICC
jgi:hypothetical protein